MKRICVGQKENDGLRKIDSRRRSDWLNTRGIKVQPCQESLSLGRGYGLNLPRLGWQLSNGTVYRFEDDLLCISSSIAAAAHLPLSAHTVDTEIEILSILLFFFIDIAAFSPVAIAKWLRYSRNNAV